MATAIGALTAGTAAASPPVISAVGSTVSQMGSGITTLTGVNPQHVGDLMVAVDEQNDNTLTATSVSGGGVTTWTRAIQYVGINEPREYEIWFGVVTSTGSSPITFTLSGSTSMTAEYEAQEFTAGLGSGTTWSPDTTGHFETVSSATVTYPSLTPAGAGELYYGFADMPTAPAAGMTSGFTYFTTADANQTAYNPAAGSGAVQPTSTQGSAGVSSAVAAFFIAHAPAPAPVVTGVSPSGGPLGGGTSVTVTGTNFTGATAVDFGSTPGTGIVVKGGGTSLTATAPAGAAGTVDVTVDHPLGYEPHQSGRRLHLLRRAHRDQGVPGYGAGYRRDHGDGHRNEPRRGQRRRLRVQPGLACRRVFPDVSHRHGSLRLSRLRRRHGHHPRWHERHRDGR